MREKLISLTEIPEISEYDEENRISETRRIYGRLADETLALQKKVGFYEEIGSRLKIYREKWDKIRALLKEAPTYAEMETLLRDVGMNYCDFEAFYGRDCINDGALYAKDTKDRYTVLWMYYDIFTKG